jgi:hypothetical protein
MSDDRPETRRQGPGGVARERGLRLCLALFASAAVLIAIGRHHLIAFQDVAAVRSNELWLDHILIDAIEWAGELLAIAGVLCLVALWSAHRYRISIGRLMLIVAILAGLLGFVRFLQRRELASRAAATGPASPGPNLPSPRSAGP